MTDDTDTADSDEPAESASDLFTAEEVTEPASEPPEDPNDGDPGGGGDAGGPPEDPDDGRSMPDIDVDVELSDIPWQKLGIGVVALVPLAALAAIFVFLGPVIGIGIVAGLSIGFLFVPALTFLSQISQGIGGIFSKLYFKLGFFGYRQPVICWTQSKYVIRELDQLEHTDSVEYYGIFGHTVGFTFDPDEAWDAEVVPHAEIESRQPVTDGGQSETNLPAKYVPSDLQRDSYGKYLPKRVRDSKIYVDAGMVLERFINSADGEKSLNKLLEAKEVHGSGAGGIDDSTVFKASMFMGIVGALLGIGIFIVPAFL